jgi:uncharacterized membrane protein
MDKRLAFLMSAGVGAGLMYLLDPDRGRRRRALARDKLVHTGHRVAGSVGTTSRDIKHRARGLLARVRPGRAGGRAPDDVVVQRVRSEIGRVVSHPSAITVSAHDGVVTLTGPILTKETNRLLRRARRVRGVRDLVNRLELHTTPDRVPALQGEHRSAGRRRLEFLQSNWSPTARLVAGTTGGVLGLYGVARRDPAGTALAVAGLGVLVRASTNLEFRRLLGLGAGARAIDIRKTMHIAAPIDRVFELWSHPENFPIFMSHVREVRQIDEQRYQWTVTGPAGRSMQWESTITTRIPNELLAWQTDSSAAVQHSGTIRFQPGREKDTTIVNVLLSYNPVAGALGHAVATLFGTNPRREMDRDLLRMKTFIETGTPARDAAQRAVKE